MEAILSTLKESSIILHDIDLTHDCRYITTRHYLEAHLEDKGFTPINDRRRVGDHCVSWMGNTKGTVDIRYKVYNKFVQMVESAEVRKSLGSRMDELVAMEGRFAERLYRHKDHGFSRLELTFYGTELLELAEYQKRIDNAVKLLKGCTTFDCSFKRQWKQRAKCITSMVAVYFPKKKLFAYCHWWNSITSKKNGYLWKKVSKDVVGILLANFSFNDRPIYYFEACEEGNSISITKEKVYQRVEGTTAITLIPGGQKGMYPAQDAFHREVREFGEMGIVEVDNITIGWPKKRYGKRSAPLAQIVEMCSDDDDGGYVRKIKRPSASSYTAAHRALEEGVQYAIVAASCINYRGEPRWHFITQCGVRVRAGKSLTKLWAKWMKLFADQDGRTDIECTKYMKFLAMRTTCSRGVDDMKCKMH